MKRSIPWVNAIVLTAALSSRALPTSLNFCDIEEWTEIERIDAFLEISSVDCELEVTNDGIAMGMIRHGLTLPSECSITLSLHPTCTSYSRIGLLFNLTDDLDGYMFSISSNSRYQIARLGHGLPVPLTGIVPSGAINTRGVNELTVTRSGPAISLFCNGSFLESTTDTAHSGGTVGMVVSGGASVRFISATVTGNVRETAQVSCIREDFDGGPPAYWVTHWGGSATVEFSGGSCLIDNTSGTVGAPVYVRGSFDEAVVRTLASPVEGDGLYGLTLVELTPGPVAQTGYKLLGFAVDASRRYAVLSTDGSRFPLLGPSSAINGDRDTLEVILESGTYTFKANGSTLTDGILPDGYRIHAAGYYVARESAARFDDFGAGTGQCLSASINAARKPGGVRALIHVDGRERGFFTVRGQWAGAGPRARGIYLPWTEGVSAMRAVVYLPVAAGTEFEFRIPGKGR